MYGVFLSFAGKGQQLAGQIGRTACRLLNAAKQFNRRRIILDMTSQELGRTQNRGQHIVEIVGYATGQLPDNIHLLCLSDLGLQLFLFGDIQKYDQKTLLTLEIHEGAINKRRSDFSIKGSDFGAKSGYALLLVHQTQKTLPIVYIAPKTDLHAGLADNKVIRVAKVSAEGTIDLADYPVGE